MPKFIVVANFKAQAELYKYKLVEWKSHVRTLSDDIPTYREEMLDAYRENPEAAIDEVASTDALATLPVFIEVLKDIKKRNDEKISELLKSVGKALKQKPIVVDTFENEQYSIQDWFAPYLDKNGQGGDIIAIFKNFIKYELDDNNKYATCLEKLTDAKVEEKVSSILEQFYSVTSLKGLAEQDKKNLEKLLRTDIFLCSAIATFIGSDNAQKMDWQEEIVFYAQHRGDVSLRKPFMALALLVKKIEVANEFNEPWHEACFYLKGFYQRVYRMMPPKYKDAEGKVLPLPDGSYMTVDPQDESLKKNFPLISKYVMVLYDVDVYEVIEKQLAPIKEVEKVLEVEKDVDYLTIPNRTDEVNYIYDKFYQLQMDGYRDDESKINLLRKIVNFPVEFAFEVMVAVDKPLKAKIRACKEHYLYQKSGVIRFVTDSIWLTKPQGEYGGEFAKLLKNMEKKDPRILLQKLIVYRDKLKQNGSTTLRPAIDNMILLPIIEEKFSKRIEKTLPVTLGRK